MIMAPMDPQSVSPQLLWIPWIHTMPPLNYDVSHGSLQSVTP